MANESGLLDFLTAKPEIKINDDFHGWLLDQASALRERRYLSLDWDNLAEELEAMAARERRELLRRLTTLFEHLLKLAYQPDQLPRRGHGWRRTIVRSRIEIKRLLHDNPGLKGQMEQFAADAYADGRRIAGSAMEGQVALPDSIPWSIDKALEADFFPS
jgi:hypothetical protein